MAYGLRSKKGRELPWQRWCRLGALASAVWLAGCTAFFLWAARGWPLVNDTALMHYVVFLMQSGLAPYREINDYNLPGAYATAWLPAAVAGWLQLSAAAMGRWTDAALLLAAGGAMLAIARPYSRFAGIFAGCLFALYHGRDGIGQAGQRDLWVTVLVLWATACLLAALRMPAANARAWRAFGFGVGVGAAVTVKPTACLFLLCALPLLRRPGRGRQALAIVVGCALPLLAAWLFLLRWGAVRAFVQVLRVDLPYHAHLGMGTLPQLVHASSIPSIAKLAALTVVAAVLARGWRGTAAALLSRSATEQVSWQAGPARALLPVCVVLGLLSFVAQGKGYPYQRYPYVAFLLLFAGLEFAGALRSPRAAPRLAGAAGLAFGVLLCAPSYARGAADARWSMPVTDAMEQALLRQAGAGGVPSLQGQVQCLDVVSGCTDALLHLRVRAATGTIYDEMLFPQAAAGWGTQSLAEAGAAEGAAAVLAQQARFRQALPRAAPRVIVVTGWLFPEGPGNYRKLALWPWLNAYLGEHYRLAEEQDFARAENGPMGFRVYVRQAQIGRSPIH